jgi:hypothetical protein
MQRASGSAVQSNAERLYRLLLCVYPPAFRREYGPSMIQVYRDLCRDRCRQGGLGGLVPLWARLLTDLATSAIGQHLEALREGGWIMTKTEHTRAIVIAVLPLVLWLVLGAVNPRFAGRMFADSSAQPWGWIMSAAVLILVTLAYLAQRKALRVGERLEPSGQTTSRPLARGILRAGSVALLVLPAILLVVLGPAIMMLLDALPK